MSAIVTICACAFVLFFQTVNAISASVDNTPVKLVSDTDITSNNASRLQAAIDARLAMYNKQYPEVLFVQLAGEVELTESLESLHMFLGHRADNLDYEHPPDLNDELLYVNIQTIIMMLEHKASSAALFRTVVNSLAERDYLCVITLTPAAIASDDAVATRDLMLDVSEREFQQVKTASYLDHLDYLKFNIDHEAFHCLDSLYNGPRPMSMHEHWGEYMAYHHHQAADAFALAMYLREHDGRTGFVRQIGHLRALSILYGDPDHYSFPTIERLLSIDHKSLLKMSVRQIFHFASELRDDITPDYENYLVFVSSTHAAMASLNGETGDHSKMTMGEAREELIEELLKIVKNSYKEIFGHFPVPARAAD